MIYYLITPLCRKCITPSPQLSQLLRYAAAKQQETTTQQDLGVALTQGKLRKRWEKIITSVLIPCLSPPDLVGQGTTMLISTGTGLLNTSGAAWKIWKKNIDLFFFLYFCLKAFGSSWFRTYSGLHQFHDGCNGCKIANLLFEKNATFIHKESPILDASGVLKCLRPHSLGWFKGEPTGNYGCP